MATVEKNKEVWDGSYNWKERGEEWSAAWGSSYMQWHISILPRIGVFLPCKTILEIAPGFGRWTQYLLSQCDKLTIVDLSEECIQACMRTFDHHNNIEYHVNDGRSLNMIPDDSIDFIFSYDSLVHVEADVIKAYLEEISRKLTPSGAAFIHHSNLGQYRRYFSLVNSAGKLARFCAHMGLVETEYHFRAKSVTAELFEEYANNAGLQCIGQEKINWGSKRLIDCYSLLTRQNSMWSRPNNVVENPKHMKEAQLARQIHSQYPQK